MASIVKQLYDTLWSFLFYKKAADTPETREWRVEDLKRIEGADGLNPAAVGKLIGAGMQHHIYAYHDAKGDRVLKLTTSIPFLRMPSAADAQADIDLVQKYFESYAVAPMRVIPLRDGGDALLQPMLHNPRSIVPADLKNSTIRDAFLDIVRRNERMLREAGHSLDFLGRGGQRKARAVLLGLETTPEIGNIVVEQAASAPPRVRVMDTDLEDFHPGAQTLRDKQSAMAARLAVGINRWLIKHFFGVDIFKT